MGIKGYKAFEKGMICRGKQYAENTIFEEDEALLCSKGIHFVGAETPLEVLEYYPLVADDGSVSEFAEVEALDEALTDDNKKYCTRKIKIGAKIDFPALVKAAVSFEYEKINDTKVKCTSKDKAKIGSSGYWAQIGSSGYGAKIGSSGYGAQIGSSGDGAKIGSSGYGAQIGSSGDWAKIGSSGDWAKIGSSGYGAVVMCAGYNSMAKAKKGSWITLAEWKRKNDKWIPVCVKTEQVDGKRIKEDTFYKLINCEFTEVSGYDGKTESRRNGKKT